MKILEDRIADEVTPDGTEIYDLIRIRKLTPKECWRLMGFTDKDFENAEKQNSNTQLYKQAGNSIVKAVLMAIFSQLNIGGVQAWNNISDDERYKKIGGIQNADSADKEEMV